MWSLLLPIRGRTNNKRSKRLAQICAYWQTVASYVVTHFCGHKKTTATTEQSKMFGAWNVPTLTDSETTLRKEQRLLAGSCNSINFAVLSETRLTDESQITETGRGHTFYWKGKSEAEARQAGDGFAVKTTLLGHVTKLPKGINKRLICESS